MSRRLLAISWEMPPLSGPRAIQVARTLAALARLGWRSTAISVAPKPGGPLLRDTAGAPEFAADGVEVARVPSPEEWFAYRAALRVMPLLARRPDRHRGWVGPATREARQRLLTGDYDRLVTFAQPWSDHLVGLRLRRVVRLPWVAHFSDPWVDSPYERPTSRGAAFPARLEEAVVREADALVFVTQQTADTMLAKYAPEYRSKAYIVPHGYDRSLRGSISRKHRRGRLRMVYTGRFYPGLRTPDALFAALERLAKLRQLSSELEVTLVGPHMTQYQEPLRRCGLQDVVSLSEAVPYLASLQAAADADVLLVIDADSPGAGMFLPSKLVDYLVWRKPIFGITPDVGASADLLRRLGCLTAAPGNTDEIAARLAEVLDTWHAGPLEVSTTFDAVAAEYDIDRTSAAFAALLDRCH